MKGINSKSVNKVGTLLISTFILGGPFAAQQSQQFVVAAEDNPTTKVNQTNPTTDATELAENKLTENKTKENSNVETKVKVTVHYTPTDAAEVMGEKSFDKTYEGKPGSSTTFVSQENTFLPKGMILYNIAVPSVFPTTDRTYDVVYGPVEQPSSIKLTLKDHQGNTLGIKNFVGIVGDDTLFSDTNVDNQELISFLAEYGYTLDDIAIYIVPVEYKLEPQTGEITLKGKQEIEPDRNTNTGNQAISENKVTPDNNLGETTTSITATKDIKFVDENGEVVDIITLTRTRGTSEDITSVVPSRYQLADNQNSIISFSQDGNTKIHLKKIVTKETKEDINKSKTSDVDKNSINVIDKNETEEDNNKTDNLPEKPITPYLPTNEVLINNNQRYVLGASLQNNSGINSNLSQIPFQTSSLQTQLPQTGEKNSFAVTISGIILSLISLIGISTKRNQTEN